MKSTLFKKVLFIITLLVTCLCFMPLPNGSIQAEEESEWFDSGKFRDSTYNRTLATWLKSYQKITNKDESFSVSDSYDLNTTINSYTDEDYHNPIYLLNKEEKANYRITVDKTGLYYLSLDYRFNTNFNASPLVDVLINNEIQYNELENISLEVSFNITEREESERYNRFNDELLPYTNPINIWYHNYLTDPFNESTTPYLVLLNEGENIISIISHEDNLELGNIYIEKESDLIDYQTYLTKYEDKSYPNHPITIQAEDYLSKNDIEIKASYYKSYKMTPNSYKSQVLNMLNGDSQSRSGMMVTYSFDVISPGMYALSLKYKQSKIAGVGVGRNIYIDGEIPFTEFKDYIFPYENSWKNHTLNKDGSPLYVYLDEGTHTISFEATSYHVVDVINRLYTIMDSINSLGISISTITGSSSNSDITWKITNYLPTIGDDLLAYSKELLEIYDYINSLNPTTKEASEVSTLKVAANQLKRLAKSPNKIQNRLSELCNGSGSAYQLIGSAIGYLISQPLDIDYFVFSSSSYKLPSANGNFFGRLFFSIKSFFYSFFDKRYNIALSKTDNTIDIYVASSNLYTNIIQEMADSIFTKNEGINVNLNILSNTQSIILNNATNTNPDLVLEIDSWTPYTYALRGMLEDLSKFEDFDLLTKDIYSSNFTPLIYESGVYGLPETQGMQLLFYRKDILESIGITEYDTWDDIIKMLPILQSYQMNFYHPLGYDSAYKGFSLTTPFFYMFGAETYSEEGYITSIGDEKSIEAIKFMTDLFTIYNLPQQVSSFFEHFRSGTLPIGVGGIDLYLQLKYACPELSGQWGVLPIPGMTNEDGVVERWTSTYGKCSIMFASSSKKDKAWKFLKWWHDPLTQSDYIQRIKSTLGEKYLIIPANMETLDNSPWDLEIKKEVITAARWSRIPAIIPGSYIVEREVSNIWNNVVINKMIVRIAVNQSIPKINRELARKFEEFKYLQNGKLVRKYPVPTKDNITNWVKGREYYEK